MKVLITEDSAEKRQSFVTFIRSLGVGEDSIFVAGTMAEFAALMKPDVDVCVIDLRIPAYAGAPADTNGLGVLEAIDRLGSSKLKMLAVSSFPEEFTKLRAKFESRGCILADFNQSDVWQSALRQMIVQAKASTSFDFLIFCALRSERAPYTAMPVLSGSPVTRGNVTMYDVTVSGARGSIIELPRMGLVDAAITAGACIERFDPKLVAMSGICAGFSGRAELGQLLVSDLSYEYQSGKWTNEGFSQAPYQAHSSEKVKSLIRSIIERPNLLTTLEDGWTSARPSKMTPPSLATFTTGSAVIANNQYIDQVSTFHRKVSGLDMEVYAIQRAAALAKAVPEVICAKTVVDLAGAAKDDELQPYGAYISAKFTVEAIRLYFAGE